ncbi:protein crumbs isoform X2 [Nasonia vitripennis]|uniref:Protein crumbs n=1 Tax=Nasonia vitripennis TaxID=7425 RepID=A0A7M7M1V7_NASVI|nr:protein crumbs isoform X2 [Nasonia vitripennis]
MRAALHVVAVLATLLTTSTSYGAPQERSPADELLASSAALSQAREAYFDGTAQLRLRSFVSVHRHSGLSFRTCEPGRLFEQRFDTGDSIGLRVDHEGLVFVAKLQQRRLEARLNARLLDNAWHTVNMFFRLGNLTLSAAGHAQVVANATYNSEILALPDENDANGTLIVGEGFRGCILQGPGILFNDSLSSNAILGACPLDTRACSPCINNPCRNGGSCQEDHNGDFVCQCAAGWAGLRCESPAGARVCDGPSNPCRNDAACVELPDTDYRCECRPGYTGRNCEIDIDECASHPCRNDGNCTDLVNGYACKCERTGYNGQNCEIDIDECENNPCLNGLCYNNYGGYVCACQSGFEGQNCELNINECLSQPCRNGGTCLDEVGSYRCNCTGTGHSGEHCDQPPRGLVCNSTANCPANSVCHVSQCVCKSGFIGSPPNCSVNFCERNPCINGGTCNNLRDRFECVCPSEWKGPTCQSSSRCPNCYNGGSCVETLRGPACQCPRFWTGPQCKEPVTCGNHRPCKRATECRDYPLGYYCVCEPGWTGPECSIDIDECTSDPCRNAGVCIDQLNNYYCQCLSGFIGKNCQINVDECLSQPCQNGGTCIDRVNGYSCNCTRDFMGENCEREYDACAAKPCQNNGSCVLSSKSRRDFVCECLPGFEGKLCDLNVDECVGVICPDERICVDGVAGYECKCRDGYREPNCTLIVDPCAKKPCGNGTCLETADEGYQCDCGPGYSGPNCENDVDECQTLGSSLCNNGICINNIGSYNCFCRPGFSGDHCAVDINECLCGPCQNNATCIDKINTFECECPPGYAGKTCDLDVNECQSDPCQNGATCIDEIARYTCVCAAGFTGYNCETNIDDCESQPCQNHGKCLDKVNAYACDCTDTGFEGEHCELNIDDCRSYPCENGAECLDEIKDYKCQCYEGYTGKNCQIDINECESSPCQFNGTCLERSNENLYKEDVMNKPAIFMQEFSYANASGYECICVPGVIGKNCETNINECESNPCFEGVCMDRIGGYVCECDEGFEGDHCQIDIDECKRYSPCEHGVCYDKRADYQCVCDPLYGGKNCSVLLEGCMGTTCLNNGTCWPYLVDETEHKFNCTCPNGFHGEICDHEQVTTMSLSGNSMVTVNTSREEGYDISFRFRTTLPNGLLAMGKGPTYYMLELVGGKLNLHSSLLNKWNGVFIGSGLNDSNWQKVFVAINSTHLVLSANEEQTIYPINLNEGANATYTSFTTTYIGGTVTYLRKLTHGPSFFVGCTEDVIINGEWIYSGTSSKHVELQNVDPDCPREPQCSPNPCKNNGHCTDRWRDFSCKCERPYLGSTCQYNITAATFGYENISNGYVSVRVSDPARKSVRSIVDISMFIRTREQRGDIFYLGAEPSSPSAEAKEKTFIAAQLEGGELLVRIQFNGTEAYTVGGVKLNDGNSHLIQIIRNVTLVQVKINGTEYFRKTISANGQLNVTVLYLGGLPQVSRHIRQVDSRSIEEKHPQVNFKGIIQDVQISNGIETMVVEFFPLKAKDIPTLVQFGNVTFDPSKVLEGVVSDNVCASNPCFHNGTCHVTWNDFWCQCPRGYTGKTCQEMEFCQLQDCPSGSKCQNLDDGYECIANATFDGVGTSFTYLYSHPEPMNLTESSIDTVKLTYRSNTGGTLMHMSPKSGNNHFTVSVLADKITVAWKLDLENTGILTFGKMEPDGNWTTILLRLNNNSIEAEYEDMNDDVVPTSSPNFDFAAWYDLLLTGSVTLGGLGSPLSDIHSYMTFGTERHIENREGIAGNSVDFADRKHTTAAPPHSMLSGEAFKGCLGEVRIGSMLLHYFTYEEVYQNANFTPLEFLSLQQDNASTHDSIGCRLCFENNCKNNGHCLDQFNSYVCDCPPGYAEDDCSIDIDECEDNKCENNSTCLDGIANYTCVCRSGWQGWLCEEDVNECVSIQPCQHDGVCVNLPGSFHCECPEQYTGELCEHFKQITCADEPCRNGSSCADVVNTKTGDNFTCTCMPGYEGTLCDTPYCMNRKCQNDGKCVFLYQPPQCSCPQGFTGLYCETNIDDCAPDLEGNVPCKNDGKCHDGINNYTCDCTSTGYTGPDCSYDINECLDPLTDCGFGKCDNLPGSYHCVCDPGYCGYNCKMEDPCRDNDYCKNGGTCECVEDKGYTCHCPPDYTGQNCTESEHFLGSQALDIAVIVGPIVGILFLIAAGSLIALFMMARKKRATRGTYSPSAQEFSNPRVEMDNVMKPPPEERLI